MAGQTGAVERLGQAEVGELDGRVVPGPREQEVLRFDVTVHQSPVRRRGPVGQPYRHLRRVRVVQSAQRLEGHAHRLVDAQSATGPGHEVGDAAQSAELAGEVEGAAVHTAAVEGDDVGVAQGARTGELPQEAVAG